MGNNTNTPTTRHTAHTNIATVTNGQRPRIAAIAVASLVGGLCEAGFLVGITRIGLAISGRATTTELFHNTTISIQTGLWLAIGLLATRFALSWWTTTLSAKMSVDIASKLRHNLANSYLHTSFERQQHDQIGRLQELMTTYTQSGSQLAGGFTTTLTSAFGLTAMLCLAIAVSPQGAIAVSAAVCCLAIALRPIRRRLRRQSNATSTTGMNLATRFGEMATLGLELRTYGVQTSMATQMDTQIANSARADSKLTALRGLVPHLYTTLAYTILVAAVAAAWLTQPDDIEAIGAVMLVMLRSLSYGQQLQTGWAIVTTARPYVQELETHIASYQTATPTPGRQHLDTVDTIELDNVTFEYQPHQPTLSNVTLTINPGEAIGIVGTSGAGKTTLLELLLNVRQPTSGTITANGHPLHTIDPHSWTRRVAYVPQSAHFINGTIADNIRFLRDNITDEQIEHAARAAWLHDDITRHPDGYQRNIGEAGNQLSGGQQQRLSIARALAGQPDVLILDEPTSALDETAETTIRETLTELAGNVTIILVAHRPSTLEACTTVYQLDNKTLHKLR